MKYLQVIFVFLLSYGYSISQEVIQRTDLKLKSGGSGFFFGIGEGSAEIIPVINPKTKESLICIRDVSNILIYRTSDSFEINGEFKTTQPQGSKLLGCKLEEDKALIIFGSRKNKQIIVKTIDFNSGEEKRSLFELGKKEKFVTFISENNSLYLISTIKKTSDVLVYTFTNEDYSLNTRFSLEPVKINGYDWPFYYVFEKKPSFISQVSPSNFGKTSSPFKVYVSNGLIRFTLDDNYRHTKVYTLDLNNAETRNRNYEKTYGNCDYLSSNSLIYNDHIFILSICENELYLSIRNLNSGLEESSFYAYSLEEIPFKNGRIVQEGGGTIYSQDRKFAIDETKKFLKKASKMSAALSLERIADTLLMTVGAIKEMSYTNGGGGGYTPGTAISTPYGNVTTPGTFNNTYNSYQTSNWSKATFFKSLLSVNDFSHLEGKPSSETYTRIRNYENKMKFKPKIKTIFHKDDSYFLCHYEKKENSLIFTKFDH